MLALEGPRVPFFASGSGLSSVPREIRIYADEAWTHNSPPKRRYWNFFGGIAGPESAVDRLDSLLRKEKASLGMTKEIKWSSVGPGSQTSYIQLLDLFFAELESADLRYRQFFTSREYVYSPTPATSGRSELDVQFLLYYQFLKHCFNFQTLPDEAGQTQVVIRLDTHSSQRHKDELTQHVEDLPRVLGLERTVFKVSFVPSHHHIVLQLCDVVMGAAGSYGNKMHELRHSGRHGQSKKQKSRFAVAKHLYSKIRALDAKERGSKTFNWFETTGLPRTWQNSFRIWKFRPSPHQLDKGWQNDNLKKGEYQAPKIQPALLDGSGRPYKP